MGQLSELVARARAAGIAFRVTTEGVRLALPPFPATRARRAAVLKLLSGERCRWCGGPAG